MSSDKSRFWFLQIANAILILIMVFLLVLNIIAGYWYNVPINILGLCFCGLTLKNGIRAYKDFYASY